MPHATAWEDERPERDGGGSSNGTNGTDNASSSGTVRSQRDTEPAVSFNITGGELRTTVAELRASGLGERNIPLLLSNLRAGGIRLPDDVNSTWPARP